MDGKKLDCLLTPMIKHVPICKQEKKCENITKYITFKTIISEF